MADKVSYGWTGKILRVNLTTGSITTESTDTQRPVSIRLSISALTVTP